jgi:hypothetical protein
MNVREVLVLLVVLLGMGTVIFHGLLRPHRIDITPGQGHWEGSSRIWQVNAIHPRNYSPRGRRLLRWLVLLYAAFAALGYGLLFSAR